MSIESIGGIESGIKDVVGTLEELSSSLLSVFLWIVAIAALLGYTAFWLNVTRLHLVNLTSPHAGYLGAIFTLIMALSPPLGLLYSKY